MLPAKLVYEAGPPRGFLPLTLAARQPRDRPARVPQ